jgi:hypothetical protein
MKINQLFEAKDLFPDVDVIKIDPDRADVYDIVQGIMPTLVRVAYTHLVDDKVKYNRTHTDEDDIPFEFTIGALEECLDEFIHNIKDKLDDISMHDRVTYIKGVSSEFKEKLDEGK